MRNMRQNILRKEDRKEERRHKKEKAKNQDDGIRRNADGQTLCPVPLVQCCRPGHPLPQSLNEGIKMCCTNPDCLYVKQLVHPDCFRSLEQGLLSMLANQGSARGWTVGHRKNNLWSKKGLTLVQRSLRCCCGKGQMKRDDEAWKEREELLELPPKDSKLKKKHKPKDLPTLAFPKKGLPPPMDIKKIHELDNHFLSAHSPPPSEIDIEERYGPPKPTPQPRTRRTTGTSICSSTTTSSCHPKPLVKKPIGLAPVESPKKLSKKGSSQPVINVSSSKSKIDLAKPVSNPWSNQGRSKHSSESKSVSDEPAVDTSSFPPLTTLRLTADDESNGKMYPDLSIRPESPPRSHDGEMDSGIHSITNSPKDFMQSKATILRPSSPEDPTINHSLDRCSPPPGFEYALRPRKFPIQVSDYEPEPVINTSGPLPMPPSSDTFYSLFHGPTFGLGEFLLQYLQDDSIESFIRQSEQEYKDSCVI